EFANRWKAARMLYNKEPYKKIEQQTGLSSTTIARVSKWLQKGMRGYQRVIEKMRGK
ncbi:MAG: DNA-binding transcriptional regulator, partial [Candidatus Moranbacteria bacterium]|nr:DNA-binding transcriptional regulator [Candidatus Moranbacteria bacterium]